MYSIVWNHSGSFIENDMMWYDMHMICIYNMIILPLHPGRMKRNHLGPKAYQKSQFPAETPAQHRNRLTCEEFGTAVDITLIFVLVRDVSYSTKIPSVQNLYKHHKYTNTRTYPTLNPGLLSYPKIKCGWLSTVHIAYELARPQPKRPCHSGQGWAFSSIGRAHA